MSADNFIGVFSSKDSLGRDSRWYTAHAMMHNLETCIDEADWKKKIENKSRTGYSRDYAIQSGWGNVMPRCGNW